MKTLGILIFDLWFTIYDLPAGVIRLRGPTCKFARAARNPLAVAPQFCMFPPVGGLARCAFGAGRLWKLNR
jgi:hypothetical protein